MAVKNIGNSGWVLRKTAVIRFLEFTDEFSISLFV